MNEYLTVEQAATLFHVSPTTVRRWIYQGNLKAQKIKTGRNGRVLIDKEDLNGLLAPMPPQKRRQTQEERQAVVDRILALQRQFAPLNIDVDALIDEHRRERDRE